MGNTQCQQNCKLSDFKIKILQNTSDATQNFQQGKGMNQTFYDSAETSKDFTVTWEDSSDPRVDFIHSQIKININKEGKVVLNKLRSKFPDKHEFRQEVGDGGYQMGDILKISAGQIYGEGTDKKDFTFKLLPKMPNYSENTGLIFAWIFFIVFVYIWLNDKFRPRDGDNGLLLWRGIVRSMILFSLIIIVNLHIRTGAADGVKYGTDDAHEDLHEFHMNPFPSYWYEHGLWLGFAPLVSMGGEMLINLRRKRGYTNP